MRFTTGVHIFSTTGLAMTPKRARRYEAVNFLLRTTEVTS